MLVFLLLEAQYLSSDDFTKIKIKAAQNLWRKMLNLIHQIVFNEIKVKKKRKSFNQCNLQKTIDFEEMFAWKMIFNFLTILFREFHHAKPWKCALSHKECLWCIKNTSSLSLQGNAGGM